MLGIKPGIFECREISDQQRLGAPEALRTGPRSRLNGACPYAVVLLRGCGSSGDPFTKSNDDRMGRGSSGPSIVSRTFYVRRVCGVPGPLHSPILIGAQDRTMRGYGISSSGP